MRIYLDNCAFNRPFDNQSDIRIRIETEAKLYIQEKIKAGSLELIWSYILDFENEQNPFIERKISIAKWKKIASADIEETENLLNKARILANLGFKAKDALHIASAVEADARYFLTTVDKILNKTSQLSDIIIISPTDFIKEFENYDK